MSEFFYNCSGCPYRTENVKIDNKDEFHGLKPYCELKMLFISKREIERDIVCLDVITSQEVECPVCGEIMDVYVRGKQFDHYGCKIHGEQDPTIPNKNIDGQRL